MFKINLRLILTLLVIVLFVVYFVSNISKFSPLLHTNVYLLVFVALAYVATILANGIFIKFILEPFGKRIPVKESSYVSMISAVGNFFAPAGSGFGFRAVYLKKKHGLSYADYMATLYGNYVIVFLINSIFALIGLYLLRNLHAKGYFTLLVLFSGMFFVSLLMTVIKLPALQKERSFKNKHINFVTQSLINMLTGWNKVARNKKLLVRLLGLTAFNFLIGVAISKLEITALHFHVSLPALVLFSVMGALSIFINITPANLGVKEAIYLFSSAVIGLSAPQILSIALIDRGILFAVLFLLWLYFVKYKHAADRA